MHKKAFFISLILIALLFGAMAYHFTEIGERDKEGYTQLKNLSGNANVKDSISSQHKLAVRKELWTPSGDYNLHTRVLSDSSKLTLYRGIAKEEIVEEMKGVWLMAQEEVNKDSQIIRVVVANEAAYHFKDERLVAEKVKLYRYQLPGTILPEDLPTTAPLLEGDAKWVEFYLKEGRKDLNASAVTLKSAEKNVSVSTQSLLFDGRLASLEGEVIFDHPLGKATAETGSVVYDKDNAKNPISEIILEKKVIFTRGDGSVLNSEKATLNFKDQKGFFVPVSYKMNGVSLKAHQGEAKLQEVEGRWKIDALYFIGDVVISDPGKGTITTDTLVTVEMGPKSVTRISSQGPSILTRVEEVKGKSHTIIAPGPLNVDHEARITTLHRSEEEQVRFKDTLGEMYADKVTLMYEPAEKGFKVKKLIMEGKVFMVHALPSEVERSYAYADRAEFFPDTMEMVLEGDRVLVFDKINKVEVSAPRLRIKRDEMTKKETIKGEGDVRFSLDEKEFQTLKTRFKLEK